MIAAILGVVLQYSPNLSGELLLPEKVEETTRTVLVIHGGGWGCQDRSSISGVAAFFTQGLGFAAYNVDYRLANHETPWPACGEDCVRAAKFMLSERFSEKTGIKPKKIWICGASAGGHLALWTALRLPTECVEGVISISGIADPRPDCERDVPRYRNLFGGLEPTSELLDTMSPMLLIRSHGPRILCTHAVEDSVVPIASARNFAAAYRAAGGEIKLFEYSKSSGEGLTGHCIWRPGSNPHRLINEIERQISEFVKER